MVFISDQFNQDHINNISHGHIGSILRRHSALLHRTSRDAF